ncbi:MAG TPA: 4Fe-4S binding protein [Candidatus Methanoperedenaceae archaeon]|nr:4Fe-4S binding protein [Candidatus Methanoperedenaceae archaeon]
MTSYGKSITITCAKGDGNGINTLRYNPDLCTGCGMCVTVCPHRVFTMRERKAILANYEACMECGACQRNCPAGAISVESGVGCAGAMMRAALTGRRQEDARCE